MFGPRAWFPKNENNNKGSDHVVHDMHEYAIML
jgi:hypothetical protein